MKGKLLEVGDGRDLMFEVTWIGIAKLNSQAQAIDRRNVPVKARNRRFDMAPYRSFLLGRRKLPAERWPNMVVNSPNGNSVKGQLNCMRK